MGRRVREATTNFTAGELSPLMLSRYDIQAFRNGAQTMTNFAPLAQGGAKTRPPMRYLASIPQDPAVVFAFVFNDDQRYAFVFSDQQVDIYQATGYSKVATLSSAPWTEAMLTRLTVTHFGDTMIVFHPDMEMQVITRTGATTFTRAAFAFEEDSSGAPMYQPYYKFAASDMTLTPGATTGTGVSLVLSGAGAFTSDHVGYIIRYQEKEIEIATVTDANNATGDIRETLPATTASADWDEAVFSAARGWAHSGEFHQNRLWLFGADSRPTGRWFSKVGAFYNFDLGSAADNEASWEAVLGPQIAEGRYVVSGRHAVLFADTGVFYQPETPANPITPDSAASPQQATVGTAFMKPLVYDDAYVFCAKGGKTIYEARYNDIDQAYLVDPISLLAPHLISNASSGTVLQDSSDRTERYAAMVMDDGNVTLMHRVQAQEITAFLPWETEGDFKSVAAVGEDLVALVERTIDGSTVWTLEIFDDDADALDCSKQDTSVSATKSFSGFTHLANETVSVTTKGHYLGTYTVSAGGAITLGSLDPAVTEIWAGFAYTQTLKPMPAVVDLPEGISRGSIIGAIRTMIEVNRTDAFAVDGETVILDFAGDDFTTAPPTETGIIEVYHLGYDKDAAKTIQITTPAKITILGLNREVEVNE